MSREYLLIYPEGNSPSSWGVFPGTGSPTYIQLTDSNAFTLRPAPVRWTLRSASGYNRRILSGSFKTMTTGALNNMVVFGSQVGFWMNWLQPYQIGGTSAYELPSCSIDHVIIDESGSQNQIQKRYLGVKVGAWSLTSNSDASLMRLSLTNLIAKQYQNPTISPSIPSDPAYNNYPPISSTDSPFVHQHASTVVLGATPGGTDRHLTGFDQFTVNVRHMLDPRFFNSTQIAYLRYCGRDVDWSLTFPYRIDASNDRVSLFENQLTTGLGTVPITMNITYSIPSSHTLALNMETNALIGSVTDDLNFNQLFMQNITGWNQVDSSTLTDFVATYT
jgi:hypothetical protein